jgi:hypothetical protein
MDKHTLNYIYLCGWKYIKVLIVDLQNIYVLTVFFKTIVFSKLLSIRCYFYDQIIVAMQKYYF